MLKISLYPPIIQIITDGSVRQRGVLRATHSGSSDGTITHTDVSGNILWSETLTTSDYNDNLGLGFAQIDGGFICCGWTGYWGPPENPYSINASVAQVDTGSTENGWLMRYAAGGEFLWDVQNETGYDNHFYSAVQLPEGGYFAAGTYAGSGYLVRYAPEAGIEGAEIPPSITLSIVPNPVSSSLIISYSLPEPSPVDLTVYDLSGRKIESLETGSSPSGEYTIAGIQILFLTAATLSSWMHAVSGLSRGA